MPASADPEPRRDTADIASPDEVLAFWFDPDRQPLWFRQSAALDRDVKKGFGPTYEAARAGSLAHWAQTPSGALALVIVLDQFPRNMFRGTARAFETGAAALDLARAAVARGDDRAVDAGSRGFFYLPFMHSESLDDQDRALALYQALGDEGGLKAAREHREVIARFGRFPHRNAALGRVDTAEEAAFRATHSGW